MFISLLVQRPVPFTLPLFHKIFYWILTLTSSTYLILNFIYDSLSTQCGITENLSMSCLSRVEIFCLSSRVKWSYFILLKIRVEIRSRSLFFPLFFFSANHGDVDRSKTNWLFVNTSWTIYSTGQDPRTYEDLTKRWVLHQTSCRHNHSGSLNIMYLALDVKLFWGIYNTCNKYTLSFNFLWGDCVCPLERFAYSTVQFNEDP